MVKVGKWIAKHKVLVLLIGLLLVIPSVIGIAETRVNYDLLSYLPDTLETVKGQDILVDVDCSNRTHYRSFGRLRSISTIIYY